MAFDGITYDQKRDGVRLCAQLDAVRIFMLDHHEHWWSLDELSTALGYPEASISARLRDLRKKKNGGYEIGRQYVKRGLWVYRLIGRLG